uniref:Uncharacterized protein n=1 Tax=Sinocyclocheilus grahami TaxID=75366 RepID=A0A672L0K3_SINGR
MLGNFRREEDAEKAVLDLYNRWFNGQPIHSELSPFTDFREACCGFCNFMHLKPISREPRRELHGRRRKRYRKPFSSKVRSIFVREISHKRYLTFQLF